MDDAKLDEYSAPERMARVRDLPVKFVVGGMSFKFPFKLYIWGHKSGGANPSMVDQNCDGMSPDHC